MSDTFFLLLLCFAGCTGTPQDLSTIEPDRRESGQNLNHVSEALDVIQRLDEFEREHALPMALSHLDLWLKQQTAPADWQPDSLVARVSPRFRQFPPLLALGQMKFDDSDFDYLREAVWISDTARWVAEKPRASAAAPVWPAEMTAELKPDDLRQLEAADRLFDWIVRNVQLDPLLPYPEEKKIGPAANAREEAQRQQAQPGPGYQRFPWQTLLLGHGDALERSRLFMLMLRAEGIDSVQLSLDIDDASARLRPWCVGVLIGSRLYLFDPALGLPLPRGNGHGIATLGEIVAHPEWLRQLDVSEKQKYPVTATELKQVVALIDAAPPALSLRMQLLQSKLKGQSHLAVAVQPSAIAERVRKTPGVLDVRLSSLPFETEVYRARLAAGEGGRIPAEEYFFHRVTPVLKARLTHLRGELEAREGSRGLKGTYLSLRIPDDMIERLPTSLDVQRELGLMLPRDEEQRPAYLKAYQESFRTSKRNASYWMGLTHFENGDYDLAVEWLGKQTLFAVPDGPWTSGARYNLARSYEALGEAAKARQYYLDGDSPQKPGDVLRARRLESEKKTAAGN